MKIAYILVSEECDYYYEYALVSLASLKKRMPNGYSVLVVDDKTAKTLVGARSLIKNYVDEYRVVCLPDDLPPMLRSRQMKTTLRNIIEGDFLYVDVDTVWADSVNLEHFTDDVMGVPDSHRPYKEHMKEIFETSLRKMNFCQDYGYLVNGGVLFMKDSPLSHEFSNLWNRLWKRCCEKGIYTDQQSLNQANYEMGFVMKLLPDVYNVQLNYSIRYLAKAKILHYFACAKNDEPVAYLLQKNSFWKEIKKDGLTENALSIMNDPKSAWLAGSYVYSSDYIRKKRAIYNEPFVALSIAVAESPKKSCAFVRSVLNKIAKIVFWCFRLLD